MIYSVNQNAFWNMSLFLSGKRKLRKCGSDPNSQFMQSIRDTYYILTVVWLKVRPLDNEHGPQRSTANSCLIKSRSSLTPLNSTPRPMTAGLRMVTPPSLATLHPSQWWIGFRGLWRSAAGRHILNENAHTGIWGEGKLWSILGLINNLSDYFQLCLLFNS